MFFIEVDNEIEEVDDELGALFGFAVASDGEEPPPADDAVDKVTGAEGLAEGDGETEEVISCFRASESC